LVLCKLVVSESVRTEGQSAGSVYSGSSSAAGFGGDAATVQAFLMESTWALVYTSYSQHL
jgi:preprotein translocase subunit SecG